MSKGATGTIFDMRWAVINPCWGGEQKTEHVWEKKVSMAILLLVFHILHITYKYI